MNKQEKNIVDIITFDETEDIVDIFIDKVYHTDKTAALITNKELVEYAMDELLNDDCITVKRIDLELDSEDAIYMISVDDGYMVVQPVEYYGDKYFKDIEYAFVDMDGCVDQVTIDNLLDRNVPVVLFGCEDECKCHEESEECSYSHECDNTEDKNVYTVTVKCDLDTDEAEKIIAEMEKRVEHMHDMFVEMDAFRRIFRW